MAAQNYLKLQNQGNIISNLRLLYEMKNSSGYADSQGYYSKADVAEIGINSLLITSGSKVGEEARAYLTSDGDESRNSPLQNAKARMQILRVLGLVASDYDSEIYSITKLGELVIQQVFSEQPNYKLLLELFVSISTATETYEHNCDQTFNCYLGYGICYAFANLDYRISTEEMPLLTTYDIRDIDEFVADAKQFRQNNTTFPTTHPHFPKTSKGLPQKNPSNLTRSINQILRACGVMEKKLSRIDGTNYYVCTQFGKKFVDSIKREYHSANFLSSHEFRKKNNIRIEKEICTEGYERILKRSGVDTSITNKSTLVFSPYQMLPEITVEWLMGGRIRKHPDAINDRISMINSQVSARNLRLNAQYLQRTNNLVFQTKADKELSEFMLGWNEAEDPKKDGYANVICEKYKDGDKEVFYPFVHSLLNLIGLKCSGEVGRYDAYCQYFDHIIPVEIKSYTETPAYNAKGARQAIENKITSYNSSLTNDIEYASLVIGFETPTNDTEIRMLIDGAYEKYNIKIIAIDIYTLVKMAMNVVCKSRQIDLEKILTNFGILYD